MAGRKSVAWWIWRLRSEYYSPTRRWTKAPIERWLAAREALRRVLGAAPKSRPLAVYDLRIAPVTFDFAYFLYDAETEFRRRGYSSFEVVILDGSKPNRYEWDDIIDRSKSKRRIDAMLVPIARLYAGCAGVTTTSDPAVVTDLARAAALVFPRFADGRHLRHFSYADVYRKLKANIDYSGLVAPESALQRLCDELPQVEDFARVVTLTVRSYPYQPQRNTRLDVYREFADYLSRRGYTPVFVPDADAQTAIDFGPYPSVPAAAANLEIRAALYQASFANVFTLNGVHTVAAFNKNARMILVQIDGAYEGNTGLSRYEAEGLLRDEQPFDGGLRKRLIWERETLENLTANFERLDGARVRPGASSPATVEI
jgi:hypothetical protein